MQENLEKWQENLQKWQENLEKWQEHFMRYARKRKHAHIRVRLSPLVEALWEASANLKRIVTDLTTKRSCYKILIPDNCSIPQPRKVHDI